MVIVDRPLLGSSGWIAWSLSASDVYRSALKGTGFHTVNSGHCLFSDDSIFLQLKPVDPDISLHYLADDITQIKNQMRTLSIPFSQTSDSLLIRLNERVECRIQSVQAMDSHFTFLTQLRTAGVDILYQPQLHPNKILGLFGEVATWVNNLHDSLQLFGALGFKNTELHRGPYPWGIVTDGIHTIGLHQTEEVFTPGIVYYSPLMPDAVNDLSKQGFTVNDFEQKMGGLTTWKLEFSPMHMIYLCQM